MVARTRLIVTLHAHCLSCYFMGGKSGQNLQKRDELKPWMLMVCKYWAQKIFINGNSMEAACGRNSVFMYDVDELRPGKFGRYKNSLRAGRFEDRIPVVARLRTCPDQPRGPPSLLYNRYRASFSALSRPRRGVDQLLHSSAEVNDGVELYHCTQRLRPRAVMACYRVNSTFLL